MGIHRLSAGSSAGWLSPAAALALLCSSACESELVAIAVSESALRPDAPAAGELPPLFAADDEVERFDSDSGFFRIHYTRSGTHAVPVQDQDADGVLDYVASVGAEYDAVLAFYTDALGFGPPLRDDIAGEADGGDDRFDVYLLDFPNSADGSFRRDACLPDQPTRCTGYMVQENDFARRNYPSRAQATRIVASHELFHAVQNAYRADGSIVLSEGTAVWASESYDGSLSDFESFVGGYLEHTDRSLAQEPSGPVDRFSYASALFFRFLEERFGRDVIRELWQDLRDAPMAAEANWIEALDRRLHQVHASSTGEAFLEFSSWNLRTGPRADPERSYRDGARYPTVSEQRVELPFEDGLVRVFPLAARFYATELTAPAEIELAVVVSDRAQLHGLELLLARETDGKITELHNPAPGPDAKAAKIGLSADSGDVIHAALVNTRSAGESARPALCFGARPAVESCLIAHGVTDMDAVLAQGSSPSMQSNSRGCALRWQPANPTLTLTVTLAGLLICRSRGARAGRRRHRT
jgi:hypothetical protein